MKKINSFLWRIFSSLIIITYNLAPRHALGVPGGGGAINPIPQGTVNADTTMALAQAGAYYNNSCDTLQNKALVRFDIYGNQDREGPLALICTKGSMISGCYGYTSDVRDIIQEIQSLISTNIDTGTIWTNIAVSATSLLTGVQYDNKTLSDPADYAWLFYDAGATYTPLYTTICGDNNLITVSNAKVRQLNNNTNIKSWTKLCSYQYPWGTVIDSNIDEPHGYAMDCTLSEILSVCPKAATAQSIRIQHNCNITTSDTIVDSTGAFIINSSSGCITEFDTHKSQ